MTSTLQVGASSRQTRSFDTSRTGKTWRSEAKAPPAANQLLGLKGREECPIFFFTCQFRHIIGGFHTRDVDNHLLSRNQMWSKFAQPFHVLGMGFRNPSTERDFQLDWARRSKGYTRLVLSIMSTAGILWFVWRLYSRYDGDLDRMAEKYEVEFWVSFYPLMATLIFAMQLAQQSFCLPYVLRHFTQTQVFWALCQVLLLVACVWTQGNASHELCSLTWEEVLNGTSESSLKQVVEWTDTRNLATAQLIFCSFELLLVYRLPFIYQLQLMLILLFGVAVVSWEVLSDFACRRQDGCVCQMGTGDFYSMACLIVGELICSRFFETLWRLDYVNATTVFKESARSDRLLANVLPESIVEQLKNTVGGSRRTVVRHFQLVSVLFADIVAFTTMSARLDAKTLVELLNRLFLHFDNITENNSLEKIKTIGDCYMVAGGVPIENNHHFVDIATMGLQMVELLQQGLFVDPVTKEPLRVRVGCHAGPVTAGVIGEKKFLYDLWGDAVNTASRMESNGEPMRVHCSQDMASLLKTTFRLEDRGEMFIKGKGNMRTHFILGKIEKPATSGLGWREVG